MSNYHVPLIVRGHVHDGACETHQTRRRGPSFHTPDVKALVGILPLRDPRGLSDLYALSMDDIVGFLDDLAGELQFERSDLLQEACELATHTTGLSRAVLVEQFRGLHRHFRAQSINRAIDQSIGRNYLEGWVEQTGSIDGSTAWVRAFGTRAVHILAGNVPQIGVASIIRNAITRSDAIIKVPSNDPLTAIAMLRTMIAMSSDHPVVRHLSAAYWKGGDSDVETVLYDPSAIDKIVAWGGAASVAHARHLAATGIDVIALEPKHSAAVVSGDVLDDDQLMAEAAVRLSLDIGALDQEACMNSRIVYVSCGTSPQALEKLRLFGTKVYEALVHLPRSISGAASALNPDLAAELRVLRLSSGEFEVIGGTAEGAVIVSHAPHEVDFLHLLTNRVANIVPVSDHAVALSRMSGSTQTVSVFPDQLKIELRDGLALAGVQRITSLGAATELNSDGPQDGLEPARRMCRWVVHEGSATVGAVVRELEGNRHAN